MFKREKINKEKKRDQSFNEATKLLASVSVLFHFLSIQLQQQYF